MRCPAARWITLGLFAIAAIPTCNVYAQEGSPRPPLTATDVDMIVALERIEDHRLFDTLPIRRAASSSHREVRRRAALTIARLYDMRGRELLRDMRAESDTVVLATIVWATGQLVDTAAVGWLDSLLQHSNTPVGVATEAAGAFGKIRTDDTHARLVRYLTSAPTTQNAVPIVSEALLSVGRHFTPPSLEWISRWSMSGIDQGIRWRAAWALAGSGEPNTIPLLMRLANDESPEVRYWAIRGLQPSVVDSSRITRNEAQQTLVSALSDSDRKVRVEALRRLGTYADTMLIPQFVMLLRDSDSWMATSAAEALGRLRARAVNALPDLRNATRTDRPGWVRASALTAIVRIDRREGLAKATALAADTAWVVRYAAVNALAGFGSSAVPTLEKLATDGDRGIRSTSRAALFAIGDSGTANDARRSARSAALGSTDYVVREAALASMSSWADSTDIPLLLDAIAVGLRDVSPWAANTAIDVLADIESRGGRAADALFARFPAAPNEIVYGSAGRAFGPKTLAAWGTGRPIRTARTDADYRRIVETLILPAYRGAPFPRLRWETTRGIIETELNALDAPLATDYILGLVDRGALAGVRFERVIPNFVAQQAPVLVEEILQRDEISRGRLVRGNVSWGSNIGNAPRFRGMRGPGSAYDTGPAVYTFGVTPQPHNEGDFTVLGHVVIGMDVVDQMQLGDRVRSVQRVHR